MLSIAGDAPLARPMAGAKHPENLTINADVVQLILSLLPIPPQLSKKKRKLVAVIIHVIPAKL